MGVGGHREAQTIKNTVFEKQEQQQNNHIPIVSRITWTSLDKRIAYNCSERVSLETHNTKVSLDIAACQPTSNAKNVCKHQVQSPIYISESPRLLNIAYAVYSLKTTNTHMYYTWQYTHSAYPVFCFHQQLHNGSIHTGSRNFNS